MMLIGEKKICGFWRKKLLLAIRPLHKLYTTMNTSGFLEKTVNLVPYLGKEFCIMGAMASLGE